MTSQDFFRYGFIALGIAVMSIGCGRHSNPDFVPSELSGGQYEKSSVQSDIAEEPQSSEISTEERKLIKSGDLRFRTRSIPETYSYLLRITDSLGGYVSDEQMNSHTGSTEQSLTLRVPAKNLDALVNAISGFAGELDYRNINVQDVTMEYIDVESRIKTKKELELRYLELLKQATKVDEVLNIERELGTLRAEIESMEGRLNYLKNQVSLSTLRVSYYTLSGEGPGYTSKILRSLHGGWELLQGLGLVIAYAWPLWVVLLLILVYIKRKKAQRLSQ